MTADEAALILKALQGDPLSFTALRDALIEQGHVPQDQAPFKHVSPLLIVKVERTDEVSHGEWDEIIVVSKDDVVHAGSISPQGRANRYTDPMGWEYDWCYHSMKRGEGPVEVKCTVLGVAMNCFEDRQIISQNMMLED